LCASFELFLDLCFDFFSLFFPLLSNTKLLYNNTKIPLKQAILRKRVKEVLVMRAMAPTRLQFPVDVLQFLL